MIDPRKEALKEGLRQLRPQELRTLINHLKSERPILLDRDEQGLANYSKGMFCPLGVAVGLHDFVPEGGWKASDDVVDRNVAAVLALDCGFKIYNTRGVKGEFYTTNRREDLLLAAEEVLEEK